MAGPNLADQEYADYLLRLYGGKQVLAPARQPLSANAAHAGSAFRPLAACMKPASSSNNQSG
jgi:hypothetical protein